jgi:hypothetical protein
VSNFRLLGGVGFAVDGFELLDAHLGVNDGASVPVPNNRHCALFLFLDPAGAAGGVAIWWKSSTAALCFMRKLRRARTMMSSRMGDGEAGEV